MEGIPEDVREDGGLETITRRGDVLDENMLKFVHSFGYDSTRRYNICHADKDTVIYISGNYIHIYNTFTQTFKFVRSLSGIGLGHIAKHPTRDIIAVGERGDNPFVVIYSTPEFGIEKLLKGGTEKGFQCVSFSPKGERLITQGGEPDYSLAIWDWESERMILKEVVGRETWKVEENPFVSGEFITSGASHITFWMLADTFTGLKLKRYPGKFGSYDFCGISTFCALPKGKIMTPNESNNLYIWRGEEIVLEVRRNGGLSLHEGRIVHVEYRERSNEIFTVGIEGIYKVWDYSRINDVSKRTHFIALQPTYQRSFQDELGISKPVALHKKFENLTSYFMQDKEGSIWDVEMTVETSYRSPRRVFMGHGSPIGDIAPSPAGYFLASVGAEGKLHIYCVLTKKIIRFKKFHVGASCLLWLPKSVTTLIC